MWPAADPEVCLGELVSLWTAVGADALHRVLVLHPGGRSSADAFEPMALFTKHHASEPGTSEATAMLLLTDQRWRGGVGQLVRLIADSGLLTDEQHDGLAIRFLEADRYVYWPLPDAWFTAESVALLVTDDAGEHADEAAVREGPARAGRGVAPPVRRWAAARVLAREPGAWEGLLATAQDLDARHGAAVVAGMFDSIEFMPAAAQARLVTKGVTWPHQHVRRAALEVVAVRDGADVAFQLAHTDPDAKIRAWAASLVRPTPRPHGPEGSEFYHDADQSRGNGDQTALF